MQKLLMVYNPHAGKSTIKSNLSDILDVFTKGGYETTVYPTQCQGDGYTKISADAMKYDLIVASGGDGTLSEAIKAMMVQPKKIPLGYIPAGSTNDVAASLNISLNPVICARSIVNGVYFDYDVGSFNGENFVYVAGFGAFTDVSYETKQSTKNILGHAAYIYEALKRITKIRGYNITIEHDNEIIKGNFLLGLISNSVSIGGIKNFLIDGVCFDDGLFEVRLVKTPKNPIEFSSLLTAASLNKLTDKSFVSFKTSKLTITSEEGIAWTLDGESGGVHTFVDIENIKQAVRFKIGINDFTVEQQIVREAALPDDVIKTSDGSFVLEDQSDIEN